MVHIQQSGPKNRVLNMLGHCRKLNLEVPRAPIATVPRGWPLGGVRRAAAIWTGGGGFVWDEILS